MTLGDLGKTQRPCSTLVSWWHSGTAPAGGRTSKGKADARIANVFNTQDREAVGKPPFGDVPESALTRRLCLRELVTEAESITGSILTA